MKRLIALPLLLTLAACSSFDSDFTRRAELKEDPMPLVAGAWEGRWQSTQGHGGGDLRAIIEPQGQAGALAVERTYAGRFKAKWGFFRSEYDAAVSAKTDPRRMGVATVHVEANVGFFAGGKYVMDGESTPTTFTAKYRSDRDEGTIEMTRPAK